MKLEKNVNKCVSVCVSVQGKVKVGHVYKTTLLLK